MNPQEIIDRYFEPGSEAHEIYMTHVRQVADFAFEIAQKHSLSDERLKFIEEAALLHDIGISQVHAPSIDCFGEHEYIEHGYLGREILEREGFSEHALVCERHTGAGLTIQDIVEQKLPLPKRDMRPVSIEEKIICYADSFYSKNPEFIRGQIDRDKVLDRMKKHGDYILERFLQLEKELI